MSYFMPRLFTFRFIGYSGDILLLLIKRPRFVNETLVTVLANISLRQHVNNATTKSFDKHSLAIKMLLMISRLFSSEVLIYS